VTYRPGIRPGNSRRANSGRNVEILARKLSRPRNDTLVQPSLLDPLRMIMTFHGRAIHESIATSAGVGVMVSIPVALGYVVAGWDRMGLPPFSAGFVSIAAVLALMPTGFLAARLGARVAHHVSRRRLELCFATYLIMVCGQFGSSLALA
jgi:hypothetical protein